MIEMLAGLRVIVDHNATARGDRVLCLPWKPFEYKQVPAMYKIGNRFLMHPVLAHKLESVCGEENWHGD